MTYHVDRIKRVRFHTEANGSFASDLTTAIATFTSLPVNEGSTLSLDIEMLDPNTAKQNMYDHNEKVIGAKKASYQFEINMSTPDTKGGLAASPDETPVGRLLGLTMGGSNAGTGRSVSTPTSTTQFTVQASHGTDDGGCMGWINANSKVELREIESVSTNDIVTKLAFSTAPATNDVMYACRTYYLDNHTSSNVESGQFVVEGLGDGVGGYHDCWGLLGGQITEPMTITLEKGQIPTCGFNFTFADWDNGDDLNITPAALTVDTYSEYVMKPIVSSEFRCGTVGTSTLAGTEYHPSGISIELGYKYNPVTSPGGTNNIVQWVMVPDRPVVKGSFTIPYESQAFTDARASKTDMFIFIQIGSLPAPPTSGAGAILISIPTVQIVDVKRLDAEGLMGQQVFFEGRLDADTTDTTAMANSPFRIHIM